MSLRSRRTMVAICIAAPFVAGAVASAFAGLPVLAAVASVVALVAPFGVIVGLGPRFEQTLYQDPNSPVNQEFRGAAGVWPYGGGAVAIGFRDPNYGPHLPAVPDDDPHRSSPPHWLLEEQGEASGSPTDDASPDTGP